MQYLAFALWRRWRGFLDEEASNPVPAWAVVTWEPGERLAAVHPQHVAEPASPALWGRIQFGRFADFPQPPVAPARLAMAVMLLADYAFESVVGLLDRLSLARCECPA